MMAMVDYLGEVGTGIQRQDVTPKRGIYPPPLRIGSLQVLRR